MTAPVITVIHGTFAQDNAEWTREDSPFMRAILTCFGGAVILRFRWSGKNSFRARHHEVAALDAHVANVKRDHGGAPHFLIGHSHGGSIVAYWIKRAAANHERIDGAAFLSTPFVAVRRVDDEHLTAAHFGWAGFAWLGLWLPGVAMAFAAWLFNWSFWGLGQEQTFTILTSGAGMVGFSASVLWYLRHRKAITAYASSDGQASLDKFANAHSTCDLPGRHYLFLKTTGDEVLSLLGTAQFIGLIRKISQKAATRWSNRLIEQGMRFVLLVLIALGLTWTFEPSAPLPWTWNGTWSVAHLPEGLAAVKGAHLWSWLLMTTFGYILLFGLFCVVAVWLAGVIAMKLPLLAFGDMSALAASFLEVGVEPLPYGAWTLHHLQWARRQNGLHHSAGYSDPRAIDLVIDWLSRRLLDVSAT